MRRAILPPLVISAESKKIPTTSIFRHPPHALRHLPVSPRPFTTPSELVRMAESLASAASTTSDYGKMSALLEAQNQKRTQRIETYQRSSIGQNEYSAMTHIAHEKRAYYLFRPINPEAANARLLCMLLGSDLVTKAMGLYAKCSKQPFSGGFVRIQAEQMSTETISSLAERYPTLKHTQTSMRLLEKSGEFFNIKLEVPLAFIFSLHEQQRIKDPSIEIEDDVIYLKIESNDKAGVIKWRCELSNTNLSLISPTKKSISEVELHDRVPDWYYPLYYGSLEKEPQRSDFSNDDDYDTAYQQYHEKLGFFAILDSWQAKLKIVPTWFKCLQEAHPTLELEWNLNQLLNVKELQDGQYRDIVILGRTINGKTVPVTTDYDLLAVIPNRNMSDDEIWELQIEANVLPAKRIEILKRYDGISITLDNLSELFTETDKLDSSKCFIDRTLYFDALGELGPTTGSAHAIKDSDSRVRYKYNSLTGYGTRAEGDLTAVFNAKSAEYFQYYENLRKENLHKLKKRSGQEIKAGLETTELLSPTSTDSASASSELSAIEREFYSLSAHHGPETANPKPEILPWQTDLPDQAGIFACDFHGDFCQISSADNFIVFCKAILEADLFYETKHVIPLNANWPKEFVAQVIAALGPENVRVLDGARFKYHQHYKAVIENGARRTDILSKPIAEEDDSDDDDPDSEAKSLDSARLSEVFSPEARSPASLNKTTPVSAVTTTSPATSDGSSSLKTTFYQDMSEKTPTSSAAPEYAKVQTEDASQNNTNSSAVCRVLNYAAPLPQVVSGTATTSRARSRSPKPNLALFLRKPAIPVAASSTAESLTIAGTRIALSKR